jgi:DNA-binding PadR family transcriptional regulator
MAQPSRPKRPKQDEVLKVKRNLANKAKKDLTPKAPKNTTRINKITKPSQVKGQKMYYKDLMDAEKSGFIKINKKPTLNEVTGKSTPISYTVTPKGNKYIKDTAKAYSKDPMKLRPKLVSEKTWQEKLSKKKI